VSKIWVPNRGDIWLPKQIERPEIVQAVMLTMAIAGGGGGATYNQFALHADNGAASTIITNSVGGGPAFVCNGTAAQQTTTKKFGASAVYQNTAAAEANRVESTSTTLTISGDFTFIFWLKPISITSGGSNCCLFSHGILYTANSWHIFYEPTWAGGSGDIWFTRSTSGGAADLIRGNINSNGIDSGGWVILERVSGTVNLCAGNTTMITVGSVAYTDTPSGRFSFGACPFIDYTIFLGNETEMYWDEAGLKTGGAVYGSYPITAPSSAFTP